MQLRLHLGRAHACCQRRGDALQKSQPSADPSETRSHGQKTAELVLPAVAVPVQAVEAAGAAEPGVYAIFFAGEHSILVPRLLWGPVTNCCWLLSKSVAPIEPFLFAAVEGETEVVRQNAVNVGDAAAAPAVDVQSLDHYKADALLAAVAAAAPGPVLSNVAVCFRTGRSQKLGMLMLVTLCWMCRQ